MMNGHKAVLSFFLISAILVIPKALKAETPSQEFRLTDVEGRVAVIPTGAAKASPAVKNLDLAPGDQVVTGNGGRVEIALKEGTVFELKENSHFEVESLNDQVKMFFLKAGRLLSRFRKFQGRDKRFQVKTPVAVASVRGTDLALDLDENGELNAGVIEGEVSFDPPENATGTVVEAWGEEEVVVSASEGLNVKPGGRPESLPEIPPVIVKDLVWFESVRDRVKTLQEEWKDLDPPSQQAFRKTAFRDTIQWTLPDRVIDQIPSLREGLKKLDVSPVHPEEERVPAVHPDLRDIPKPR